jgi:hypothetical protein
LEVQVNEVPASGMILLTGVGREEHRQETGDDHHRGVGADAGGEYAERGG